MKASVIGAASGASPNAARLGDGRVFSVNLTRPERAASISGSSRRVNKTEAFLRMHGDGKENNVRLRLVRCFCGLLFFQKLGSVQMRIDAVLGDQFFMCAAFGNRALV